MLEEKENESEKENEIKKENEEDNLEYEIISDDNPKFDLTFKLIVIGDSGVGKSCLTMKATKNIFENYYSPTIGFEFYTFNIKIKEKLIRLQIWDTCGQEVYRSLINSFYRNSSLAILLYSITSIKSFKNLELWLNDLKVNSNPNIKIFLIGNKKDLEEKREVPIDKAKKFYEEHDIEIFMESSAKTGFNAQKIFIEAAKILYQENKKLELLNEKDKMMKNETYKLSQDDGMDNNDESKKRKKCC
jgi:small GTP-binding protein